VTVSAGRKPRPGSAAIHGGANVTMLSATVTSRTAIQPHESSLTASQTSL
jgi:hypothetical protein